MVPAWVLRRLARRESSKAVGGQQGSLRTPFIDITCFHEGRATQTHGHYPLVDLARAFAAGARAENSRNRGRQGGLENAKRYDTAGDEATEHSAKKEAGNLSE